jgi:tetratricopeptide (TPR) repeat protein
MGALWAFASKFENPRTLSWIGGGLVVVAVALAALAPRASLAEGESVPSDSCKVSAGGIGSGGNSVTCNFGLTPEQLKVLTEAAVKGATDPLVHQIAEVSKTLGVTEDAAKTLLRIVGQDTNIPEDKLAEALSKVAADYQRLQAQVAASQMSALNADNPTARTLVEQARPEIDAGRFDHARDLLRQAREVQIAAAQQAYQLADQARAAGDAQMLGAASAAAAEGDVAMTERNYVEAAKLFRQAADDVPSGHASERGGYLQRQEDALYREGDERGDNAALENAIAVCRRALEYYPRAQAGSDWASTQMALGNALWKQGERESRTEHLTEAVAAYRAALEERPRGVNPLDWAAAQVGIGIALARLGERESGTARLEDAVAAFRAALLEYTRERAPLGWAMTQNNLGNTLETLGERESGTARLEEAVAAYRAALQERARDIVPLDWAMTQNNLGNALTRLGERESGRARLEEAVAAYRAALEEETRERAPLQWAATRDNLASALAGLGARESGTARLEEAVAAHRAALLEYTHERAPLDWAMTQTNLGNTLETLGEREHGTARLEEAVAAYRAALTERTREQVPLQWANSSGGQGVALMIIADRTNDAAIAARAVDQIKTAYETERAGGQQMWAAFYEEQLPQAQAILDRLKGKGKSATPSPQAHAKPPAEKPGKLH